MQFIGHPLGTWLLGRDIERRLQAFGKACADPSILADLAALTAPPAR